MNTLRRIPWCRYLKGVAELNGAEGRMLPMLMDQFYGNGQTHDDHHRAN